MRRNSLLVAGALVLAFLVVSTPATAQVTVIPSPTVPTVTLDFDTMGYVGPISEAVLLGSFTSPTALTSLGVMPLFPPFSGPSNRNYLAADLGGGLAILTPLDPVSLVTDYNLSFSRTCTEFGITVVSGLGPGAYSQVRFSLAGGFIGSATILVDTPTVIQVAGGFDSVEVRNAYSDTLLASITVETSSGLPAGPFLTLTPSAGGVLDIDHSGLATGAEVFTMISADDPASGGLGSGPFVGLEASTPTMIGALLQQLSSAAGPTNPFHFIAPDTSASWGPYTLPSGVVLEAVTFYFDASQATPAISWVTTTTTLL